MDGERGSHLALVSEIETYGSTIVALSGGVDSALLAAAAHRALGANAIAVTADSPTLPRRGLAAAVAVADQLGIRHRIVPHDELADPRFVANGSHRCYFCKGGLLRRLTALAEREDVATVCLGVNLTDLGDWRPGIEAARRGGARFPLVEAGFEKADVRTLARRWGLDAWNAPAAPCLASRVVYGQPVTSQKLARIEAAEDAVWSLGFDDVRVRSDGDDANIEVPGHQVARLAALMGDLGPQIRAMGFRKVTFQQRGLHSGRLNDALPLALRRPRGRPRRD